MSEASPGGQAGEFDWASILRSLIGAADLSYKQAEAAMGHIMAGNATPAQIAGFLVSLRAKGETTDEMAGLVAAMRRAAVSVDVGDDVVDLVGTGGDGLSTFNISTTGALIAAGAGVKMAKHGNRAASSKCGAADVLEALGMNLEAEPELVARMVTEAGFGFFFAPRFHPSMRHAGPVRRELGVPTVFNFLGPLANPANARRQATGVGVPAMAEKMVGVLDRLGSDRSMVFVGDGGMDELTLAGPSTVWQLVEGAVETYELHPGDVGLESAPLESVVGGDPSVNRSILEGVLAGKAGPTRDISVLNAAAAIWVSGLSDDMAAATDLACESIDSGRAADVLHQAVALSNEG